MGKPIYSITPFTLLDYPDKTACILWFAGCNMRCVYCYNSDVVLGKGRLNLEDVLRFLKKRKGLLDAVVFSGGECTLHTDIIMLAQSVKNLGLLVKIDTNGTRPDVLRELIIYGLVDYVALDFKAPQSKYKKITGINSFESFSQCVRLLNESRIKFEIRTTLHTGYMDSKDILWMCNYLSVSGYKGTFYIQYFRKGESTFHTIKKHIPVNPALKSMIFPVPVEFRNDG